MLVFNHLQESKNNPNVLPRGLLLGMGEIDARRAADLQRKTQMWQVDQRRTPVIGERQWCKAVSPAPKRWDSIAERGQALVEATPMAPRHRAAPGQPDVSSPFARPGLDELKRPVSAAAVKQRQLDWMEKHRKLEMSVHGYTPPRRAQIT